MFKLAVNSNCSALLYDIVLLCLLVSCSLAVVVSMSGMIV